jgi:hypothetical protein
MSGNKNQGSKWIRQDKRWAIYMRDGFACAYCERSAFVDGDPPAPLTLDHLHPRELGGGNEATNLVTACRACNTARATTPLAQFVGALGQPGLARSINKRLRVKIDVRAAREHMKADAAFVTHVRTTANSAHTQRETNAS